MEKNVKCNICINYYYILEEYMEDEVKFVQFVDMTKQGTERIF